MSGASDILASLEQTLRVYSDRLVTKADQEKFFENLVKVAEEKMRLKFDTLMERFKKEGRPVSEKDARELMFCDFYDLKVAEYTEVLNIDLLRSLVEEKLEDYNRSKKKPLNIVIFRSVAVAKPVAHISSSCPRSLP